MSSIRDAYKQGIGFYNAGDVEGLVNLCTEDATRVTPLGAPSRAVPRSTKPRAARKPPSRTAP